MPYSTRPDPRVAKLFNQLQTQKQKVGMMGGSVPSTHPSLLSRIFDVVSRPNYAMAGTIAHAYDKLTPEKGKTAGSRAATLFSNMPSGFIRGLEGKDKYHWADVFHKAQEHGAAPGILRNRVVQGGLGLVGDVATDPLSYVGGVFEKAVPAVEEAGAGMRALSGTMGKGIKPQALLDAIDAAQKTAREARPGKIGIEAFGKEFSSPRAYEALAKVGRPVAATSPVQWANEAFRNAAYYPGKLKSMMRVPFQSGVADTIEFDKAVMKNFRKLTPEEGHMVSAAIEHGAPLQGLKSKHGIDLQEVKDFWLHHKNAWEAEQQAVGISRPWHGHDDYIPKKFASHSQYESDIAKKFRGIDYRVAEKRAAGKAASFPTLKDLKDANLNPHENIVDIMRLAAVDHQRAMARSIFKTNALDEFGARLTGKGRDAARKVATDKGWEAVPERLLHDTKYAGKTVFAPPEVTKSFKRLHELYQSEEAASKFWRSYDGIQRLWKTSVTTPNPGHHIRNLVGDAYLNFEAGVHDVRDYTRGLKVMRGEGTVKIGKLDADSSWLKTMYHKMGGASGFYNTELVGASTPGAITEHLTRPVNEVMDKARGLVAHREDFMRSANFINYLKTEGDKLGVKSYSELEKLVPGAIERVKKFNFDYGDLTPAESWIRRAVPFYSFMRKNIPLQLEMIAMHPNKIANAPKGFRALEQLLGTDSGHLPVTEILPAYLKEIASVRLRGQTDKHDALYGNIPVPMEDISRLFSGSSKDVIRNLLNTTSPLIKGPIELGENRSLLSGQDLNQSIPRYLLNQSAITRNAANMVAPPGVHRKLQPGETGKPNTSQAWINWLTGAGLKDITAQSQLSELRRQQDPVQARLRQLRTNQYNKARRRR